MQRRSFLGALLATAALDPERLLWVPKKTIFVPKPMVLEIGVDLANVWDQAAARYYVRDGHLFYEIHFPNPEVSYKIIETISKEEFRRRYPTSRLTT